MAGSSPGELLYGLVARRQTVLAEHSLVAGNAHLVAHRILEKVPPEDTRVSFAQDRQLFHVAVADGITYLCMANEELGRRTPYAFLEDLKARFAAAHGAAARDAVAYELDDQFGGVIRDRMAAFNSERGADQVARVRAELGEVRDIMIENIDKVLDRGERIELLVDKTDHLQQEAFVFTRDSRRLKRRLWWQKGRLLLLLAALVLLVCYALVCFVCSPTFHC